jgi:VWFA-related protein
LCAAAWITGAVFLLPAQAAARQAPAAPAAAPLAPVVAAPSIRITSPEAGSYVTGLTTLSAEVNPASVVTSVVFFVDGRQVCSILSAPFRCDWNAGTAILEHEIRAVVNLKAGGRIVRTAKTRGVAFADSASVEAVQVPATVRRGGRFVDGLTQDAFRVFEDGRLQTVTSFTPEDVPIEIVVAIDISNSLSRDLGGLKQAVKAFLSAIRDTDRVTLLGFNSTIYTLARRETDPAARAEAVDRLQAFGATALYDVIIQGLDLLNQQPGKKALVVFTDGEDQGSQATLAEVESRVTAGDAVIYTIGQGRGTSIAGLKKVLERLAEPTGGRVIATEEMDELQGAFKELIDELSHQYLLGYVPRDSPPGTRHEIRVEVPGYEVRARRGYISK